MPCHFQFNKTPGNTVAGPPRVVPGSICVPWPGPWNTAPVPTRCYPERLGRRGQLCRSLAVRLQPGPRPLGLQALHDLCQEAQLSDCGDLTLCSIPGPRTFQLIKHGHIRTGPAPARDTWSPSEPLCPHVPGDSACSLAQRLTCLSWARSDSAEPSWISPRPGQGLETSRSEAWASGPWTNTHAPEHQLPAQMGGEGSGNGKSHPCVSFLPATRPLLQLCPLLLCA